jgi:hypothetical protein
MKFNLYDVKIGEKLIGNSTVLENLDERLTVKNYNIKTMQWDVTSSGLEAASSSPLPIFGGRYHGLIETVEKAYNEHYPLVLDPDSIWVTITQGLANHINENAEDLREQFVDHDGKKMLMVRRDNFSKGSPDNDWPGVFDEFSAQIKEHIGKKHDLIVSNFSTTTPEKLVISEIVLMDAMKSYFDYGVMTCCGIPWVRLEGTVDDWKDIRERVACFGEFGMEWWTEKALPVLDQFVAAAEGNIDVDFWKTIYQYNSGMSGGPTISGWILNLFPYLEYGNKLERNDFSYHGADVWGGLRHSSLPGSLSKVPFTWFYYNQEIKMEFIGGVVGFTQGEDLALSPSMGWGVREILE